ncbi:MAG: c-type cytochrome domain-containing protein, partial [Pirellulaceae bacterium]
MQARKYSRLVALAILIVGPWMAAAEPTEAESEYFEKQVRPILVLRCYECHSEDSVESDLRVDSLAGLLRGGKRGAAIVAGKPEKSLLVFAINHATQLDMPPKTKLPVAEIAA